MFRTFIFFLSFGLLGLGVGAQSIVQNGDFESFSVCPTINGQITNATNWVDGVISSDFMNCAFNGWAPHIGGAYEGTGFAGGASYGDPNGGAESYGQFTSIPFISGQPYRFRFYAKKASSGAYSNNCGGICFYGRMSAPGLTTGVHPDSVPGSTLIGCSPVVTNTTWGIYESYLAPSQNFTFLWITEGTSVTSANCLQYIYIDSLSVVTSSLLATASLSFYAEEQDNGVLINWRVSDEANLKRFEVERKQEGGKFETIAGKAVNHSSEYEHLDAFRSVDKTNFYRIRQIFVDGSEQYSAILAVDPKDPGEFTALVSPNPFQGLGSIDLNLPEASRVSWQVFNTSGQMVRAGFKNMEAGQQGLDLKMQGELPGVYFLQVNMHDKAIHTKFVLRD